MSGSISLPHRLWRVLPPTARRAMLARVTSIFAPSIEAVPPARCSGIAIAGELTRASGMGEAARLMMRAAQELNVPVWPVDIGPLLPAHTADLRPPPSPPEKVPPDAALLVHVNAPFLPVVLSRLPRSLVRGRRVVGCWAWELERLPSSWGSGARFVHEAWVPSDFAAVAVRTLLPGRVRTVPHPLIADPPCPAPLGRTAFGLPADALIVLVSFNLASSFERKNPLGAIAAFREAFGTRTDRLLVLKIGNASHAPADLGRIREAVADSPNIRIETRVFPRAESLALTASADIVLSLHRSEGFGLVPAEAMFLGRAVVATGWSGNLGFMDETCAALVAHRLVPVHDPRQVYTVPGALWAEPDVMDAARWLTRLADPELRARLGDRAARLARQRLGSGPLAQALAGIGAPLRS